MLLRGFQKGLETSISQASPHHTKQFGVGGELEYQNPWAEPYIALWIRDLEPFSAAQAFADISAATMGMVKRGKWSIFQHCMAMYVRCNLQNYKGCVVFCRQKTENCSNKLRLYQRARSLTRVGAYSHLHEVLAVCMGVNIQKVNDSVETP